MERSFGKRTDIEVIATFEESRSAKSPGRPIFARMLARIEAGEAEGIITWAPDRLARNSIDGGQIIYLLDCGVLRDLKFSTYTFENNSQGKFMLSIMFGQSKYYSDALSENIKRGNQTKIARGWRPSRAPIGYLNCPTTRTIIPDPDQFPLIRRMFELVLTGAYSPRVILIMARDEWGLRTRRTRRGGGVSLALSTIYKILGNPFYCGRILWNGELYPGQHQPMVTLDEFEKVQRLLGRTDQTRPKKHCFAFTGLMRCGSCGMMITAETKTNKYGSTYVYYHCTKRGIGPKCAERPIAKKALEKQFANFLASLTINSQTEKWVRAKAAEVEMENDETQAARQRSCAATIDEIGNQLRELTALRLRRLMSDSEFVVEKERLETERRTLQKSLAAAPIVNRLELLQEIISFSKCAVDWFWRADDAAKRLIVKTAGWNFFLKGKILSVQAVKPFFVDPIFGQIPRMCRFVEDVRTFSDAPNPEGERLLKDISDSLDDPEIGIMLANMTALRHQFEVEEPARLVNASN